MRPQLKNSSSRQGSSSRGFSLIELLIVVAVILIIAAIAVPNYIRSKMTANEAAAVQNLRTISTAEYLYASTYGISYSSGLPALAGTGAPDQNNAQLIDGVLAGASVAPGKSGYLISYTPVTTDAQGHVSTYAVNAGPLVPGSTGHRYFYTDQTCVIRWNGTVAAGPSDSPIQ